MKLGAGYKKILSYFVCMIHNYVTGATYPPIGSLSLNLKHQFVGLLHTQTHRVVRPYSSFGGSEVLSL